MRLENAAGPDDHGHIGHDEAFEIFPKHNRELLEVTPIFGISCWQMMNCCRNGDTVLSKIIKHMVTV